MHPLRSLHEYLSGLSAQRRFELWRDLFRSDRDHHQSRFDIRKYSHLPYASTLNGSCSNVCPVKINIHEQIYKWRQVMAERNQLPLVKKETIRIIGKVMSEPRLYRAAISGLAFEYLPRFAIYNWLNPWGRQREVPAPPEQSFRSWYLENRRRQ